MSKSCQSCLNLRNAFLPRLKGYRISRCFGGLADASMVKHQTTGASMASFRSKQDPPTPPRANAALEASVNTSHPPLSYL